MSSSHTCMATSDILPLAASGPVSDMPRPILIGSAALAVAAANSSAATAADHAKRLINRCGFVDISIPFVCASGCPRSGRDLLINSADKPQKRLDYARFSLPVARRPRGRIAGASLAAEPSRQEFLTRIVEAGTEVKHKRRTRQMQDLSTVWRYPVILIGGALQGSPQCGQALTSMVTCDSPARPSSRAL